LSRHRVHGATFVSPIGVLEKVIPFDREISVIGGRGPDGVFVYWSPFENVHRNGILDLTTWPARIDIDTFNRAADIAMGIAEQFDLRGVMCVEMFVVGDEVIVNEIAPRPHNSGHLTIDASRFSQFEQQLRAVCGFRLGGIDMPYDGAAMVNLLGDLWETGTPNWAKALEDRRVILHLYGKQVAKPGRKMGHLTAMAATPDEARQIVLAARAALRS
jgi:5-(carboxyamino)imidazole ribonucleotide synthase